MRSFGRHRRTQMAIVAICLVVSAAAEAQTARERYESAMAREASVRALMSGHTAPTAPPDLIAQVSQVMTAFEILVRRFPTSGYADNALFQAASLAETAYDMFKRPQDRERAIRYYDWLIKEYPTSGLVKRASDKAMTFTATPEAITASPELTVDRATLAGIERTVMASGVRIIIELDREVRYREQRLSGPARVFFDLQDVQTTPELKDKVLTYTSDVVNKIRVGRHPDSVVRVVLDLEDVAKYSVFTLYSPFRIVVDAERSAERAATVDVPPLPSRRLGILSASPEPPRLSAYAAAPLAPLAPRRLPRHRPPRQRQYRPRRRRMPPAAFRSRGSWASACRAS